MPQVLTIIPLTVISKFVTIDEGAFISIATTVVFGWMVLLMFIANTTVHQYSFGKSLLSMALTVIGVLILLLLAILIMSLFFEMYDFVKTIYQELVFRIKF